MLNVQDTLGVMMGGALIDDAFIEDCRKRVETRCKGTDIRAYKRKPAARRLEIAAVEAIVNCFRDHHPKRNFKITSRWPRATVVVVNTKAVIEIYIGEDYEDDGEGIDPVEITVDRGKYQPDVRERVQQMMAAITSKSTLELKETAPATPAPAPRVRETTSVAAAPAAEVTKKRAKTVFDPDAADKKKPLGARPRG